MLWRSCNNILVLILLLWCEGTASAQLLDQHGRDTARVYRSIERALQNPDRVYALRLKKQKLKEFPMEILQFKNLNMLDLGHNKLKNIPPELSQLEFLQELSFGRNKLYKFPTAICELIHIKRLNLSENFIDAIPKEIGDLQELEVLDLWSNDIYFFPEELMDLMALKYMDLRTIQINQDEQDRIMELLPHTKIYFSTPCNCGF